MARGKGGSSNTRMIILILKAFFFKAYVTIVFPRDFSFKSDTNGVARPPLLRQGSGAKGTRERVGSVCHRRGGWAEDFLRGHLGPAYLLVLSVVWRRMHRTSEGCSS